MNQRDLMYGIKISGQNIITRSGKYHRNPKEAEKSLYAVYSHSHSGIPDGTGKGLGPHD